MSFSHLHVHNEYSLLDGIGTAEQWASHAKALGFTAIGLTNHGNIDGCLAWQKACDRQGISPILGAELYVTPDIKSKTKSTPVGHITIWVKNQAGWEELCRLITRSYLEGYYRRPRIDYEMFLNCDLSGWVIGTACLGSFLNLPGSADFFDVIKASTNDFYFEIMPANHPKQLEYHIKELRNDLPLLATVDCHYLLPEHNKLQDVLIAIKRNQKWNDPKRWALDFRDLYMMTPDEVFNNFKAQGQFTTTNIKTAMANTQRIVNRCGSFRIEEKPVSLPMPPGCSSKMNTKHPKPVLDQLLHKGMKDKGLTEKPEYWSRLSVEQGIIDKKDFESYFLIVEDVVEFCKREGIRIGPGRGSVGGSLIADLLDITQIDPIKYDLLFSRFISEDRNDFPDIDIDFERAKRHLVIEYLENTYKENFAVLSTYPRIKTRGAIRDVSRVFELPEKDVAAFANLFAYNEMDKEKFDRIAATERAAIHFRKKYPEAFEMASAIIGQIRGTGQHPAAVILSSRDLRDGTTCTLKRNKDGKHIVNWAMDEVEHFGLLKLDILGLSTLSVLDYAEELINANNNKNHNNSIDLNNISYCDSEVFRQITEGKTAGVFQISAKLTTKLCMEMHIESFDGWIAAIALVRPGPMDSGMTADYIRRKHGADWPHLGETYEQITKDTYGILVYQEQVMQVISRVAGLTESEADRIRKVIGKKRDPKEFTKYQKRFFAGCVRTGKMSNGEARAFWKGLEKWANYGFNKAHSTGYAIIGYWTAWLKVHHPHEFYCAALTYGDSEKQALVNEMIAEGYNIVSPKVDKSDPCRWTFEGNDFFIPFSELKSIGESSADKCCHVTKRKTKRDLFGKPISTGRNAIEKIMDKIGACDDEVCEIETLNKHLRDFNVMPLDSAKEKYPELIKLLNYNTNTASAEAISKLEISPLQFGLSGLIKQKRYREADVIKCNLCDLEKECKAPVPTSIGQYNAFILLEAPGADEDDQGKGAVGRAGSLLWEEIEEYGYTRRHFHVSNTCHCYPSKTKTPTKKQIVTCVDNWLDIEITESDCRLVLACGNTPLYALSERSGGIQKLSGTTEWIDDWGLWVCWCVHPSAVLRNSKANKPLFEKGIKNFIDKLEMLI